jgi:antitoxin Phd
MKTLRLRDGKATLSAVVEAAERGGATTITKHGKPAAVVVPLKDAERIYPSERPSFVDLLLEIPESIEVERARTPLRVPDLSTGGCLIRT